MGFGATKYNNKIIERVFIIYHGVDNDGYFSAALLKRYFQDRFNKYRELKYVKKHTQEVEQVILLYPGFYERTEQTLENIKSAFDKSTLGVHYNDIIAITDFSFKEPEFIGLLDFCRSHDCHEIFWFDHHGETIEELQKNERLKDLNGLRNPDRAAVRLVWEYIRDSDPVSYDRLEELVDYVGNFDTWNFDQFSSNDPTLLMQNSLVSLMTGYFNDKVYKAEDLLKVFDKKNNQKDFNTLLSMGGNIQSYIEYLQGFVRHSYIQKYRWRMNRESPWMTIAVGNLTFANSLWFNHVIKDVDFCVAWRFKDPLTMVSLYSFNREDHSETDVAKIAVAFGGSGHRNAAGCHMSLSDFRRCWLRKMHRIEKKQGGTDGK
jgi:oligoribonuclease NrnB/cAMP/cGMP phosphodiesterase (DHH superfamily)